MFCVRRYCFFCSVAEVVVVASTVSLMTIRQWRPLGGSPRGIRSVVSSPSEFRSVRSGLISFMRLRCSLKIRWSGTLKVVRRTLMRCSPGKRTCFFTANSTISSSLIKGKGSNTTIKRRTARNNTRRLWIIIIDYLSKIITKSSVLTSWCVPSQRKADTVFSESMQWRVY